MAKAGPSLKLLEWIKANHAKLTEEQAWVAQQAYYAMRTLEMNNREQMPKGFRDELTAIMRNFLETMNR